MRDRMYASYLIAGELITWVDLLVPSYDELLISSAVSEDSDLFVLVSFLTHVR